VGRHRQPTRCRAGPPTFAAPLAGCTLLAGCALPLLLRLLLLRLLLLRRQHACGRARV
jgi:hypothetical protein